MLPLQLSRLFLNNFPHLFGRFLVVAILVATTTSPFVAFSATQSFTTRLAIGGDTVPPTVPNPLSATPVSDDQIDLAWGASVDDLAVAGYRVFRDAVQIATTTLTTFIDSGLMASTTYTYSVDAFDIFYNFSSSSALVATTTLAVPVVPPASVATSSPNNSGTMLMTAESIRVIPDQFSATFDWTTNVSTRYVLRWGRTSSYELGSVFSGVLKREHTTVIANLESATLYHYEVEAINALGVARIISRGEFVTNGLVPVEAIPNVAQFRAVVENESVRLSWVPPEMADFSSVRILRSHLFYPQHPFDGTLVYEGGARNFVDSEALRERSPQYYTIFVYDTQGRISSGAVAVAMRFRGVPAPEGENDIDANTEGDNQITENATTTRTPLPPQVDLSAMDIALTQGTEVSYLHTPQVFDARAPVFVSIPVTAVPRHLKSIVVSVSNPGLEQEVSSYLLKINADGTAYEAYVPAPLVAGKSTMTVTLYDYELAVVRTVSNTIEFIIPTRGSETAVVIVKVVGGFLLLLWVLILVARSIYRRWREDN